VRDTGALLRPLLPSSIAIALDAPTPVWVCADRSGLEQLLMTLALNARDAMPDGGTLEIVVRARAAASGEGAGAAVLRVRDTGVGMAPAVRAHLFEPFFTTKPAGAGTGLGLAAVYGIVRQARGAISVDSAEGAGTTFSVTLPLVEAPADRAAVVPAATATVVLAEDEDAVRLSVQRLLERAGHTVLAVPDGGAALRLLLERDGRADLLLTDATMPVLGGRELARRVAERWPALPVVLMSGYTEWDEPRDASGMPGGLASVRALLEKPFTAERLRAVVADALG
jgi:CheY-like chemotaxis protein